MNHRDSPLYWSIPCGTWFHTRVRMSVFFPLLALLICLQMRDLQVGLVYSALMVLMVVLHEFGHVFAARMTGGNATEIVLWPLGGLATVQPAGNVSSRVLTAAAGPLVNLAICGMTLPTVLKLADPTQVLNPFAVPEVNLHGAPLPSILLLTFCASWILLLVNILPVYPFDGGRILHTVLTWKFGSDPATQYYLYTGCAVAIVAMIAGILTSSTWLVFIGAIVLVFNMLESIQLRTSDTYDDSFMGYDFSQGYTSLERGEEPRAAAEPGVLKRWMDRRKRERDERRQQREQVEEQQLDVLLDKVHAQGIESLTEAERRQLRRASARFRDRGKKTS